MKLIYVAGKYTDDHPSKVDHNIRIAKAYTLSLWEKGYAVICPHLNTAHFEEYEKDYGLTWKTWMDGDLEMIRRCDAIFMLPNWRDSKGAVLEHALAEELGIEIYYNLEDVPILSLMKHQDAIDIHFLGFDMEDKPCETH